MTKNPFRGEAELSVKVPKALTHRSVSQSPPKKSAFSRHTLTLNAEREKETFFQRKFRAQIEPLFQKNLKLI